MNTDAVRYHVGQTIYRRVKPEMAGLITGVVYRERHVEFLASFGDNDCERTYQAIELTPQREYAPEEAG